VAIEVDPLRNAKGPKDVERNVDLLVYWCREIWEQIYSVRQQCPEEMRKLFQYIRQLVETRYPKEQSTDTNSELPRQSVSAFCFLRFIVPAILHPHLFGLCSGLPDLPVQRSLTLIAKVIQSLANLNATVQREEFMRGVKTFLEERLPEMLDYILTVSTPGPEESSQPLSEEAHDRSRAVRALHERKQAMIELQRDSIPHEQHFLDVPRHLAIITSATVRQTRNASPPEDPALADFCNQCRDVERQALRYVSRHAAQRGGGRSPASRPLTSSEYRLSPPTSHHSPVELPRSLPPTQPRLSSSHSRPMTAPSGAMSDPALHTRTGGRDSQEFPQSGADLSASAELGTAPSNEDESWRVRHPHSISTDSIPNFRDAPPPSGTRSFVEAVGPQNVERKKWFFRNMLNRK